MYAAICANLAGFGPITGRFQENLEMKWPFLTVERLESENGNDPDLAR
jgi:hypothetical protein